MREKKHDPALWAHILLFITECVAFYLCIGFGESHILRFYTQDSNLFELLISAVWIGERLFGRRTQKPSRVVRVLSYTAACMLTVTFLVVLFILAPQQGPGGYKDLLLNGPMLFMHFLCPVVALVSFLFFEKAPALTGRDVCLAMLPTLLYAAVTIVLNVLRGMEGPYPFLRVYEQSLGMSFFWAFVVIGGAFLIAWALKKLNGRLHGHADQ